MTMDERLEAHPAIQREPFLKFYSADLHRQFAYYEGCGLLKKVSVFLSMHALWVLMVYRLGRSIRTHSLGPLGMLLWPLFRMLEWWVRFTSGIILHVDARIGPGFYIGHFGSTFVGPGVVIGRDCSLGQTGVLSGDGSWPDTPAPVIGDRVYMAVGAKVIGPITVGDDASVGANAVLFSDVPPMATVVGNPAKIVNYDGSARFLRLPSDGAHGR